MLYAKSMRLLCIECCAYSTSLRTPNTGDEGKALAFSESVNSNVYFTLVKGLFTVLRRSKKKTKLLSKVRKCIFSTKNILKLRTFK